MPVEAMIVNECRRFAAGNFGGDRGVQSLSEIFIRVADAVEAFGFLFFVSQRLAFLPDRIRDGYGKEPDLFEQLDDGETDEF